MYGGKKTTGRVIVLFRLVISLRVNKNNKNGRFSYF